MTRLEPRTLGAFPGPDSWWTRCYVWGFKSFVSV